MSNVVVFFSVVPSLCCLWWIYHYMREACTLDDLIRTLSTLHGGAHVFAKGHSAPEHRILLTVSISTLLYLSTIESDYCEMCTESSVGLIFYISTMSRPMREHVTYVASSLIG